MCITSPQIKEARALLRLTSLQVARKAKVEYTVMLDAQRKSPDRPLKATHLAAIRRTLEGYGIVFFDADGEPRVCFGALTTKNEAQLHA